MDEATTIRRGEPLRQVTFRKGSIIEGKYRLLRTLGRGGMGQVFAARDEKLARDVAIKVLRPDLASNPTVVRRFLHEARAAGALRSKNAIRIFDVGRLGGGTPYIVMELLEGEDLSSYVNINGAVEPLEAIELVLMACDAAEEAHAHGIVHRDLKPANLFLTRDHSGRPTVKVLDFGLAKSLGGPTAGITSSEERSLTKASDVLGSPQFMAPEQIRKPSEVDVRADVWSLGATLHHLVTGRTPYSSGAVLEVLARVLSGPPRPVREIRPTLPQAIEDVISRCLKMSPEERFSSIGELAAALRDARAEISRPAPPAVIDWVVETEVIPPSPRLPKPPTTIPMLEAARARPRATPALAFSPRTPLPPPPRERVVLVPPDLEPIPSTMIPSATRASLAAGAVGMVAVAFAVLAFVQAIAR